MLRYTEWNSGYDNISTIAAECDVLGANLYPFYVDSLEDIDANLDKLGDMLENVQTNFPDTEIWITETGFPSGGDSCSSEQTRSNDKTQGSIAYML